MIRRNTKSPLEFQQVLLSRCYPFSFRCYPVLSYSPLQ